MAKEKRKVKRWVKVLILILILILITASQVSRRLNRGVIRLKTNIEREVINAKSDIEKISTTELRNIYGTDFLSNNIFDEIAVTFPQYQIKVLRSGDDKLFYSSPPIYPDDSLEANSLTDDELEFIQEELVERRKIYMEDRVNSANKGIKEISRWKKFVDICKDITAICIAIMAVLGVLSVFGFLPEKMSKRIVELKG